MFFVEIFLWGGRVFGLFRGLSSSVSLSIMSPVNYFAIIHKFIPPHSPFYQIYIPHVSLVTAKALHIARKLRLSPAQQQFIEEAAMLHDIGIVNVAEYGGVSFRDRPYICHAPAGRDILEQEGLARHALVAERHIGLGITKEEILRQALPLPLRDMLCESLEEKIVCWADLFFSKTPESLWQEKTLAEVEQRVIRYGPRQLALFWEWRVLFDGSG